MKRIALVLCAMIWALGAGLVVGAQGTKVQGAAGAGTVGTVPAVDETSLAIGDRTATTPAGNSLAGPSTLIYFLRMILVLAIILVCIYGVFRLMRRLSKPKEAGESPVKVVGSTPLGPGKFLHVVTLGSKAYIVGATDTGISLISEIDDRELVDSLILKATLEPRSAYPSSGRNFASTLASFLAPGTKTDSPKASRKGSSPGEFLAGQRERLRKF